MMSREKKSNNLINNLEKEDKKERTHKRIGIFLKIFFTSLFIILLFIGYMYMFATKGLNVREYKIEKTNLPENFHGFKIVHFSDLHYLTTVKEKELTKIVNKINELKPDMIVFTGDLFDKDKTATEKDLKTLTEKLNQLEATTAMYTIKGNHDYYSDNFEKVFNETNFKILNNKYDLIYYHGTTPILITGIGCTTQKDDDIESAYSYNETDNIFTISLLHEPDTIDKIISTNQVDLTLAGHSHNGQIRIPGIGAIIKVDGAKKYSNKHYTINQTDLYISGGLGTSALPLRFFNKPSINFYRLTKDNEE